MKVIRIVLILFASLGSTVLLAQTSIDKQNLKKYFKDYGDTTVYKKYFENLDSAKNISISVQSNSAKKFYDNMPTISQDTNIAYNMPICTPGKGVDFKMPVVPFSLERNKNCDKIKKKILKLPPQDTLEK